MAEINTPSRYAADYLDEIKKDYLKLKDSCDALEREYESFFARISLDMDAFNIEMHSEHPPEEIFQIPILTDRDSQVLGEYLSCREKMYLLELCVRSIEDEDTRRLAKAYYLERKTQSEIAAEIGRTKSYVSKKLDKAEKGEMTEAVNRYFAWKFSVPGGKDCFWAGKQERDYMIYEDAMEGRIHLPDISKADWIKNLRRMGF